MVWQHHGAGGRRWKVIYAITALGMRRPTTSRGIGSGRWTRGAFVRSGPPTCHMQPNHVSWAAPTLALLSEQEEKPNRRPDPGLVLQRGTDLLRDRCGAGKVMWSTATPTPPEQQLCPQRHPGIDALQDEEGKPFTVAISAHGMVVRVSDGSMVGMVGDGLKELDTSAVLPIGGSFLSWVAEGDLLLMSYRKGRQEVEPVEPTTGVRLSWKEGDGAGLAMDR